MSEFLFTTNQITSIMAFRDFSRRGYAGYCSVCLRLLFAEEVHYVKLRTINDIENLNCNKWGYAPTYNTRGHVMVCDNHRNLSLIDKNQQNIVYPGAPLPEEIMQSLTYREKGALSPIKIMSSIVRRQSNSSRSYL